MNRDAMPNNYCGILVRCALGTEDSGSDEITTTLNTPLHASPHIRERGTRNSCSKYTHLFVTRIQSRLISSSLFRPRTNSCRGQVANFHC